MKILTLPNPLLHQKAKPVKSVTPKIINIITEMVATLKKQKKPPGVGLAAPQVGYPLQIFLLAPPSQEIEVFINPKILEKKGVYEEKEGILEGCLSLHGYYGHVQRANKIKISFRTLNLSNLSPLQKTQTYTGFPAVIIQHEMDHLKGKLFIDRLWEQKGKLYKIRQEADKENKEVLEEVKI